MLRRFFSDDFFPQRGVFFSDCLRHRYSSYPCGQSELQQGSYYRGATMKDEG